jgi:hypothetical protein
MRVEILPCDQAGRSCQAAERYRSTQEEARDPTEALTAGNRPGEPEVGHDELSAMATAALLCWLTGDTYAVGRINDEIEKLGFTPEQVTTMFG